MNRNLWGESVESQEEAILRRAKGAVERKGYTTYSDFAEFIQPIVLKAKPSLKGRALQYAEKLIRDTLMKYAWVRRTAERNEVMFYPPGSPLLGGGQAKLDISM